MPVGPASVSLTGHQSQPTSKVSLVAAIKSSIQGGDKLLSQRFQQADVRQKKIVRLGKGLVEGEEGIRG